MIQPEDAAGQAIGHWIWDTNLRPLLLVLQDLAQAPLDDWELERIQAELDKTDAEATPPAWCEAAIGSMQLRVARDRGTDVVIVEVEPSAGHHDTVKLALNIFSSFRVHE